MSCCKRTDGPEPLSCSGVCANERKKYLISDPQVHFYLCRNDGGCFTCTDCNSLHSADASATNACAECCQCAEEMVWNSNKPPKPDCRWLNNFSELRRQWSNHARRQNCKCCNCR